MKPLRVLFALPGLHRVARGAEAAFENIAIGLVREGFDVTLIGTGPQIPDRPYRYLQGKIRTRETFLKWPRFPPFRSEYRWEELSFCPSLWKLYRPADYDFTVTCSYPFVNWLLRAKRRKQQNQHVYITENGDWAAQAGNREYRFFGCDALVCTNPEYFERNRKRWRSTLIPNGVDTQRFTPAPAKRSEFGLPDNAPVVCMVSALIPSKFPLDGIRAVAALPDVHLLLAGDGPLRAEADALGAELLGPRYHRLTVPMERMPDVYRCGNIFLHLSRDEAFGNIYIEAAACGLPVVAHRYPTTEWILGDNADLIDGSDAAALIDTLRRRLAEPPPGTLRDSRRDSIVQRFDWSVVCAQYATFFREIHRA